MSPPEVTELSAGDVERLAAGRLIAVRSHPYLATALFALQALGAHGLGTFAVDRHWRLYVDPDALRRWEPDEISGVLLHEVAHLVRDHAARAGTAGVDSAFDGQLWNLACDMAINDDLRCDRVPLPAKAVWPSSFDLPDGQLEEDYYAMLSAKRTDTADHAHSCGVGSSSACEESPGAGGGDTDSYPPPSPDGCGSASDGRRREWELPPDDPGTPGLGSVAAATIQVAVAEALRRQAGDVPAGWQRWARQGQATPVDWRRQLRHAVTRCYEQRAGHFDTTYRRLARRHQDADGVIFPGHYQPSFELAVIIDTSGSVSDDELASAVAQIDAIRRQCRLSHIWVIPCDAAPSQPYRAGRTSEIALRGGGGTDLRPAIALLPRLRPRPDVAVVITDGYTPWPPAPPPGTTLIVATTDQPSRIPGVTDISIS